MLSDADIESSAVSVLRGAMEEADRRLLLAKNGHEKRTAVFAALRAVSTFLGSIGCKVMPLLVLSDTILQLDNGTVDPVLQKKATTGRARTGVLRGSLEGHVIGVVKAMVECGDSPLEARRKVARVLRQAGVRPARGGGEITARTIRAWGERASADSRSPAARYLARFPLGRPHQDPEAEKASLLRGLAGLARRFAEKPANPRS